MCREWAKGFGKRNCFLLRCGTPAKYTVLDIIVCLKMVAKYPSNALIKFLVGCTNAQGRAQSGLGMRTKLVPTVR